MRACMATILLALLPMLALAQGDDTAPDTVYTLSPIVVAGTVAKERETPATFTDLTASEIRLRYSVQDVPVVLSELPSMTTYSENGNGIGYNYINLRGFDQRRISVMINGVPQNDPEENNVYWIDFPDLLGSTSSLQVQRGAGSAFYGPPAIGGSINLTTDPFQGPAGISLESMFGFQQFSDSARSLALNTKKFAATVNSGLVGGHYMFFARLGQILSDGYRTGSYVKLNSYFLGAMRIDGNMTTRIHFFGGPLEDGLAYNGLPKFVNGNPVLRRQNLSDWGADSSGYTSVVPRRPQEIEQFSQPHYELLHEWKLSPGVILHNTLFYYTGDGYFDYDASWADTTMLRLGSAYGFPTSQNPQNALVRAFVGNRQFGWLPRVEISHDNGTLTLGAEIRVHRSIHWGKIQYAAGLPANFDPDYHFYQFNGAKDIVSAYAHELYRLDDQTTLMTDLQLVRNRYGFENEKFLGNAFSVPYLFLNPRAGINHNFNEELNAYVSLAYTSREPTMTNLYAGEEAYYGAVPQFASTTVNGVTHYDFGSPRVKPERLLDAELGTRFQTNRMHVAADVYWMEFSNELVKSGQVDIFGQPITVNAQRTRHIGLEVEGAFPIGEQWTISANATVSRNRLVRYTETNDSMSLSYDGNPIAGFPDFLGNIRCTYEAGALTASLAGKYVGPFYTDNYRNAENRNDPFAVWNGEILWRLPRMGTVEVVLRGEVRNIFNKLYFLSGEGNAFFPAAERSFLLGMTVNL